jgi:hypothetical protein
LRCLLVVLRRSYTATTKNNLSNDGFLRSSSVSHRSGCSFFFISYEGSYTTCFPMVFVVQHLYIPRVSFVFMKQYLLVSLWSLSWNMYWMSSSVLSVRWASK